MTVVAAVLLWIGISFSCLDMCRGRRSKSVYVVPSPFGIRSSLPLTGFFCFLAARIDRSMEAWLPCIYRFQGPFGWFSGGG